MIAGSTFGNVFGLVPPGDPDDAVVRVAMAAAEAGYAVVVCNPGQKVPMCTLTTAQAKAADNAARLAAGGRAVRHACGIDHAIVDRAVAQRVIARLVRQNGPVNLGLELAGSRMVCVDVDTAAENAAFLADWSAATGQDETGRNPTVRSPGALNVDGQWVHRHGGHYWFTLPVGVELPVGVGALKAPSGWCAMWARRQVLVPPSSRPEGAYELVGGVEECPPWLLAQIRAEADAQQARKVEQADRVFDASGDIASWSVGIDWSALLEPDGWLLTSKVDGCGCPIWLAPGDHASPKSATAHELGCARRDTSEGHGPLHIWTDNPPSWLVGQRSWTKLQYIAARDHDGSVQAALVAEGLNAAVPEFPGFDPADVLVEDAFTAPPQPVDGAVEDGDDNETKPGLWDRAVSSAGLDDIPDPEPLIAGMLDCDTIARILGKSGHGKSFLAIDLACSVATGKAWQGRPVRQGPVVYVIAEGARGFKRRIRAWERRHNGGVPIPDGALILFPFPIQAADAALWREFRAGFTRLASTALVVLDTQARVTVGVDENDNTAMGMFVEQLERVRRDTGACVLVVHHLGHHGEQGRGASAVLGAMNTEIRVTKEGDVVSVLNDKQKDEREFTPIRLELEAEGASAVLVELDTDPFAGASVVTPESSVRDRMAAVLYRTFNHGEGATRAELRTAMAGHPQLGVRGISKTAVYRAWNQLLADDVLVQMMTAEGSATQRFKLSPEEVLRLGLKG